jgi:hypothetical protein
MGLAVGGKGGAVAFADDGANEELLGEAFSIRPWRSG